MGASVGDYNNDGWPDLLVTCFGGVVLYRNNGDGTFTDVTKEAGLGGDRMWATGAAFGDYDGDGWADLFVSHYVDFRPGRYGRLRVQQYMQIHGDRCAVRAARAEGLSRQPVSQQPRWNLYRGFKKVRRGRRGTPFWPDGNLV